MVQFGEFLQGLVDDLEALRESLSIESWVILGGSWGVTLGLAYSIAHPDRCVHGHLRKFHA